MCGVKEKMRKHKDDDGACWNRWCCYGRCLWFQPLLVAAVVALSIVALVTATYAAHAATLSNAYTVHRVSSALASTPPGHVIAGTTAITLTLPNNLVEHIGMTYNVDCASPLAHTIVIQPGTLFTTWDGVNRKATCNTGASGVSGFSFHVISQTLIRITSTRQMIFSV